jgi:hypothetical protein
MGITWDPLKARKLRDEQGIDIREVAELIADGRCTAILRNPSWPSQFIFVVPYHDYTHVVPFVIAKDETLVMKTVYPSRRFHNLYGESNEGKT